MPLDETTDLREWLVSACRTAREEAGLNRTVIASNVNKGEDVVRRFETLRGKWSPITGKLVEAYADATGVSAVELWTMAIQDWQAALAKAAQESPAGQDKAERGRNLRKTSEARSVSPGNRQQQRKGGQR